MEDEIDAKLEQYIFEEQVRNGVKAMLLLAGYNPDNNASVIATPKRFLESFYERIAGYKQNPKAILATRFDTTYDEMIVLRRIEFSSTCEHHLLPFTGYATVGYIPFKGVVGISKLARLVDCFALRLQIQERLTEEIAKAIIHYLGTGHVGVVIEAVHQCMTCRGVKKQESSMVTSYMSGAFRDKPEARQEFLRMAGI